MLVEDLVFYDFTDTLGRFEFKYLHMSNKEKVIEVSYSLIGGYEQCLKVCSGHITINNSQIEKEITYDEEEYCVNQILVAKESVGGGLLR